MILQGDQGQCDDAFDAIPDVDLREWLYGSAVERAAFADRVQRVCHDVGFFQLVGHGIDSADRAHYFEQIERFFALPHEVKSSIDKRHSPHFRGWEDVGSELTDNRVDHREQLDLLTEYPPHTASTPRYLCIDGPNQWLPEAVVPGFRATVESMVKRLAAIADVLLEVFATGLGVASTHFRTMFGERPLSLVKLISYPPTPPGEAGVNPHHDAGFLTLLMQHSVGGLSVLNPRGEWIEVPFRPDVIIVNLGEILQRLTGNYFVATTHRVITSQPRLSAAYFHGPDLRTVLEPLDLDPSFARAVEASSRHVAAGFMATRDELLAGERGTVSRPPDTYGQQLWNYYRRSYPGIVRSHHQDVN